jgi:hypothetical protein
MGMTCDEPKVENLQWVVLGMAVLLLGIGVTRRSSSIARESNGGKYVALGRIGT